MLVFLLLLRPPIFRLNEDAILHIFLYLSAKDRICIERGKYTVNHIVRHMKYTMEMSFFVC